MARQASVRAKNGYWYSEAGGKGRYLGRCDTTTQTQAMAMLFTALAEGEGVHEDSREGRRLEGGVLGDGMEGRNGTERNSPTGKGREFRSIPSVPRTTQTSEAKAKGGTPSTPTPNPSTLSTLTVNALKDKYLAWVQRHRSDRLHDESERHLKRFCEAYGQREAESITGADLEAFTDTLHAHAPLYVKKHATTIRTMFNRARKAGWLPHGFQPFASVEGIKIDPKPLLESDLPTDAEVQSLLALAEGLMADIIAIYHATGCRTHELIEARVGDFQPQSRTIVLGRHKRSKTMKSPTPRTITLNAEAYEILKRRCEGRGANESIIVNRNGKPYDSRTLANRFQALREKAGARDNFTIYSYRHLWISEALMTGLDALLVARMAGTSVAMIERVYGHFRCQSLHDAQAKLDAARRAGG